MVNPRQRFDTAFRDQPKLVDALVTIAVVILHIVSFRLSDHDEFRRLDTFGVILSIVPALLTYFRRSRPIQMLGISTVLAMMYWVIDYPGSGALWALVVLLYSTAVYASERRHSTRVLVVFTCTILAVLVSGYLSPGENEVTIGLIVTTLVLLQLGWLAGESVRNRRDHITRLEREMHEASQEQDHQTQLAVDGERNRIARELHDVVAHAMSVIVLQAEGAKRLVGKDDEAVAGALAAIEHTGRTNLTDIRGIVGLLRADATAFSPTPELANVPDLVAECRAAGLPVNLQIIGEQRQLPTMLELSGYRVVQESLTNVRKHAGPKARAWVVINYSPEAIGITINDDGRGAAADSTHTHGHGITGMRERVEAFGGTLTTKPRPGGGFLVEAHLPQTAALPVNPLSLSAP